MKVSDPNAGAVSESLFRMPKLLLHPNIPKPLHGCAPRVVLGKEWWEATRQAAYRKNRHCCWACGVHKSQADVKQWLEAHETYKIDYASGRMELDVVAALCHLCHNYIHSGRLQALLERGEVTQEFADKVERHGDAVLRKAGLLAVKRRLTIESPKCAEWGQWRMVIQGKEYGPTSRDFEAWERGDWKQWKPEGKISA